MQKWQNLFHLVTLSELMVLTVKPYSVNTN